NGRIPLAMQNARVGQDTPVSSPPGGSASCRQAPCFQSHATAFVGAELLLPTAMHQREGRHETPASTPRLFVTEVAAAGLEVLAPAGPAAAIATHPRTVATAASRPMAGLFPKVQRRAKALIRVSPSSWPPSHRARNGQNINSWAHYLRYECLGPALITSRMRMLILPD